MTPARITALEATVLNLPLRVPFGLSGGAQPAANNVLVTVELDDGTRGLGEAAPLPPYNGETQSAALATLQVARRAVVGLPPHDWRSLAAVFRAAGGAASGSAQCAFETALLDALARQNGQPLWRTFGGAGTELETDMTITTGSVAEAGNAAQGIHARGIRMIKVKIGGNSVAHDAARIIAIHSVTPNSPLILDGNAGMSRTAAGELIQRLGAAGIAPALLEQWLAKGDLAGMRALHEESGWPVAADESATSVADVRRIVAERAAQVVNIKLMKAGVAEALDIATAARAAGLGLMIGGNIESILAMTTSACFAAGLGGFQFADLDTPFFLAENPFRGGFAIEGGRVSVGHITAGHGVTSALA